MQRSRYTHIAKQVFPYSQESTTGSLQYSYHNRSLHTPQVNNLYLPLVENHIHHWYKQTLFIIGGESVLIGSIFDVFSSQLLRKIGKI